MQMSALLLEEASEAADAMDAVVEVAREAVRARLPPR